MFTLNAISKVKSMQTRNVNIDYVTLIYIYICDSSYSNKWKKKNVRIFLANFASIFDWVDNHHTIPGMELPFFHNDLSLCSLS